MASDILRTSKGGLFTFLHLLASYRKGLVGFCTQLDVLGSLNEQIFTLQNWSFLLLDFGPDNS